jgi:hypothetical protein
MTRFSDHAGAPHRPSGHDMASLGPSDSSDSGSDSAGTRDRQCLASDSDATGTGEGPTVDGQPLADGADILPDHLLLAPQELADGRPLADPWLDEEGLDQVESPFDVPGSAFDNPDLLDTTADAEELVQDEPAEAQDEEARSQDLDGFTQESAQWPTGPGALPGHRGVQ